MKLVLTLSLSLFTAWPLLAVGKEGVKGKAKPSGKVIDDYAAVRIMARHCAGCHQEADHPGALILNQKKLSEPETIRLIRKLVDTEQMPPVHQDFKSSADGKQLLRWLVQKEKRKE